MNKEKLKGWLAVGAALLIWLVIGTMLITQEEPIVEGTPTTYVYDKWDSVGQFTVIGEDVPPPEPLFEIQVICGSDSCDDGDDCTVDYCNESTGFKCVYEDVGGIFEFQLEEFCKLDLNSREIIATSAKVGTGLKMNLDEIMARDSVPVLVVFSEPRSSADTCYIISIGGSFRTVNGQLVSADSTYLVDVPIPNISKVVCMPSVTRVNSGLTEGEFAVGGEFV